MELTRRSLEIGPIELFGLSINPTIHFYGVVIVLGIIAATALVAWLAKRDGKDPEFVWNGVIWVVILAVVGARLWSVIFPAESAAGGAELSLDYLTDLDNGPLAIWSGGLSIFGAILGGALGIILYTSRKKLNRIVWIDRVAIALPLGQAIGRWGNYINEELYGEPTDLPWGITISTPIAGYSADETFHPLFLYESLGALLICIFLFVLWRFQRDRLQHGDFILLYVMGYSLLRFSLEFIRIDIPTVGGVNVSQVATGIAFVLAAGIFFLRPRTDERNTYPPFGEDPTPEKSSKGPKGKKASSGSRSPKSA